MYYQEIVLNGILCCRHSPGGKWIEMSKEQLTQRIVQLESLIDDLIGI